MKEHIIINKDRTVVVPDSVRKIGIQYDHKVNTLTFDCPRYADDNQSIDMSRMAIYINFSRNDKTKGSVAATNIFVDPDNPEIMHFDVDITRSVTLVNGPIICLVCAKSTDVEGVEVNHWNSELFNKLSVGEGLEAEELTEEEIDYITSLLQEINTTRAEVADMDTRVEDLEFNQEKQGAVSEVDLEAMTWTEGSYITGSGAIGSSSGYGISELVTLPKMSTLILDATGYQSDVAMIAKSDHTPLVTSVDGKTHYEYYTDEEIQVYISCKTTAAKSAKIVRNVGETLSDLERENGELKEDIEQLKQNGGAVISSVEPMDDDIPKVFIDGNIPTTKDDVIATMRYASKTDDFFAYIKIKCQGASSMSYPKKNFTVKLYSDEARETKLDKLFKDWKHEENKFVLKANYIDHSHARNIVSARLWNEVVSNRSDYASIPEELQTSPRNGAIDGFPIKVYTNGTYQGIYTWNIGKDAWMWNMDEENPNHVLLCAETNTNGTYAENACNFRALWNGVDGSNWSVEVGTNSSAVKDSLNALITCVKDTDDEQFKATIGNHLDINSAIDYYIHQYVICGLDGLAKNMLLGTYDLTKWYCGAYDMDSTFGLWWNGSSFVSTSYACPEEYQERFSLLWERIEKAFVNELKERYSELRQSVYSISNMFTHFEGFMDAIGSNLYAEDLEIYTGIPSGSTNNIKQIRDYIRDRLVYCDNEFANMTEKLDIPATGISLSHTSLSFTDTTPITLTATVEPSDTTDLVIWSSSDEAIVIVVDGVVTPLKNGSAIITATAGNVSVSCSVTISEISEMFTITRNLTGCTSSSEVTTVEPGSSHSETLSPNENFTLDGATITVTMGDIDISSSYSDGTLNIESITGNIVITAVAVHTNTLYPLVNGEKTIGSYTVSITNGNHVSLVATGVGTQVYIPISDITRLYDASALNNSSNIKYVETNFTLKSGDVVRLIKSNISATIPNGYTSLSKSSINLMCKTGEFKLCDNLELNLECDKSVTVSSDLEADGLILWHAISGKFSCEFDIELYVNDIRYV